VSPSIFCLASLLDHVPLFSPCVFTYLLSFYEKGNLCTSLKLIEASGSHRDHPLDLDQDLLTCHQGVEDEVKFPEWDFFILGDWIFLGFDFVLMVFFMQVAGH